MGTRRRTARLLLLPLLAVLAACGTTVPQTTSLSAGRLGAAADTDLGTVPAGTVPAGTVTTAPVTLSPAAGDASPTAGAPAPQVTALAGAVVAAPGPAAATPLPGVSPSAAAPGHTQRPTGSATPSAAKATASRASGASSAVASTAPLKIGYDYFDAASSAAANSAAGVTANTSLTAISIINALVKYQNDHGGLGGRQVVIVPHAENDMSSSYATDAQAACTYFTQDNPVPVVLDVAWGAGFGYNTCLTKAGVEDVSLPQAPDAASLGANPYQVDPVQLTPDRAYSAALVQLVKAGTLKAGTKIGVFTDKCTTTAAAYADTIGPEFRKLGLVPDVFSANCIGGYDSLGAASTDASTAILQFRGNGDTQVMMVTANDSTYWVLYGANAASQQYNTGLIMTSYSQATAVEGNFTATQKANIHGVGWSPTLDTTSPKLPGSAAESSCDAMAAAEGQNPASNNDQYEIYTICAPVLMLKAALSADGANATAPALSKAIRALGTSFADPGVTGGGADFARQDAVADVTVFGYAASCSCLQYSGAPTPA